MKKHVIFILCCVFALSAGKVMANCNHVTDTSVSYAINLGDVSELDMETLDMMVNEALAMVSGEAARCSVTATASVGVISVSVTVEDDCDKVVESAKKAVAKVKEVVKELLS